MTQAHKLVEKYPLISDQVDKSELQIILAELEKQLSKNDGGSIVEFGCYTGTTSLFITRLLQASQKTFEYHVYDSFQGLPKKGRQDQSPVGAQFKEGELLASKAEFILNFKKSRLRLPHIHKGWFEDLTKADVPNTIIFAFLDGDYYQSVMSPLKLMWEKLAPGAVVMIDDYYNEALPGASKAVDEWLINHAYTSFNVQSSLGILRI